MMNDSIDNITEIDTELWSRQPSIKLTIRIILYSISIIGIILNCTLFCNCRHNMWSYRHQSTTTTISSLQSIRRRRRHSSITTKQSLSLLSFMAAADTVSLTALIFILSSKYIVSNDNQMLFAVLCKLVLFLIHTSSAFSLWCWLVLSIVRYVAIYRPYSHLKLTNEPKCAAIVVLLLCALFESWILIVVQFSSDHLMCIEDVLISPEISHLLHPIEICWSFFVPFICITIIDVKVLCFRSDTPAAAANLPPPPQLINSSSYDDDDSKRIRLQHPRSRSQQFRVLRRCLFITIIDLGLNLPNYLYRLYTMLLDVDGNFWAENITQVLYFGQFSLNAFYLVYIIYDAPKSKTTTTNQQQSLAASNLINNRLLPIGTIMTTKRGSISGSGGGDTSTMTN